MHQKVCIRITGNGAGAFSALTEIRSRLAVTPWSSLATSEAA
jgi:hypothetical protein